jgi:hypothetical protein
LSLFFYDILVATVVPDNDHVPRSQESYKEPRDDPSGTRTPPTPALSPSHDPPPPAPPLRQRAMAQLRPVSLPAVIKDMADEFFAITLRDFDGHYMPHGHADADDSARGLDHAHSSDYEKLTEFPEISAKYSRFDTWYLFLGGSQETAVHNHERTLSVYSCSLHYCYY